MFEGAGWGAVRQAAAILADAAARPDSSDQSSIELGGGADPTGVVRPTEWGGAHLRRPPRVRPHRATPQVPLTPARPVPANVVVTRPALRWRKLESRRLAPVLDALSPCPRYGRESGPRHRRRGTPTRAPHRHAPRGRPRSIFVATRIHPIVPPRTGDENARGQPILLRLPDSFPRRAGATQRQQQCAVMEAALAAGRPPHSSVRVIREARTGRSRRVRRFDFALAGPSLVTMTEPVLFMRHVAPYPDQLRRALVAVSIEEPRRAIAARDRETWRGRVRSRRAGVD